MKHKLSNKMFFNIICKVYLSESDDEEDDDQFFV